MGVLRWLCRKHYDPIESKKREECIELTQPTQSYFKDSNVR